MSFLEIHLLWHLLWVVPVICILYLAAIRKRRRILKLILGSRADDPEFVLVSKYRRNVKFVILLLAVFFLALAAARPYWGQRIIPYSSQGRDLMVLFDVSKSMLAKDVQPSRMDHAKWFLRRLVSDCGGDRFGLIAFAGASFLECPLTTDRTSFFQYLDELDTNTIPVGGTNIQNALETALKAFKAAESGHRAVILITDGDELEGNSSKVIEQLKEKKIPVIVVGIGDPMKPGLIPLHKSDGSTGFMKDSKGELVKTQLNEKQLRALALATGGCYARSTAANINLNNVLQRVQGLIPHNLESGKQTRPIERFYYPLVVGLLLLLSWFCISERQDKKVRNRLKTGLSAMVIASLIAFGAVSLSAQQPLDKSNKLLPGTKPANEPQQTEVPESQANDKVKKAKPEETDPVAVYNKALKLQKAKDKKAVELYRKAINLAANNEAVRSSSYQNLGVIRHEAARQQVIQSLAQVKQQNLDGALKGLDAAKQALAGAEEHYVEAMALAESGIPSKAIKKDKKEVSLDDKNKKIKTDLALNSGTPDSIAMNQQKLLRDRQMIDQLKKKIEELKKKQKQAQKKTQQAKQKQQQQNKQQQKNKQQQNKQQQQKQQNKQDQKQKQQQQKQNQQNKQDQNKQQQNKQDQNKQQQKQQNKQDQKQDQHNKQQQKQQNKQDQKQDQHNKQQQNKQDQQKSPEQARKEAQKAVDDLKKAAKNLDQKKLEKSADEAAKELKKAEESQKKNQGKEAEKHLKKALEKLQKASGQNKQKKDKNKSGKNNNKDQNKQNKDSRDKNKNKGKGKQDKKLPQQKQQAKSAKAKPAKEKDIDPKQAEAILRSMANEEKNLRDAMKANLKRAYQNNRVEKDW